ncbi:hypothetical protein BDA99DRAFT_495133 [Phascolomyces articulosus]|uniref:GPI ethanolamine phosphate transferase 3 n=1 Tax=Phascolomyces articulosus TaxID=60185 RepID=A0AAD5PK49_9FUNG|nr:hypothetical protein BDA99DRAFT_495133 [Phascolomyces articulosus]
MIVIDALRFDFVTPMPPSDNEQQYYHNQLPIIEKLHHTHPSSSLLYQFRADPPTTTMQRVKGLMTGSLPTFIDAGANFASSAVNEDHLLRHVRQRYNNIYFMGDDTWVNLFPEVFDDRNKTFESDSFKMFDLHTVDNRILDHLWPLMSDQGYEKEDRWQVAIAHFLGVDHCGHTYGPSHPNMANKLSQMNDIIERLTHHVDENTLLVVMGDHGMSVEGDHGGESVEELMSALFLYSGRQLTMDQDGNSKYYSYYRDLFDRIHRTRAEKLGYPIQEIVDRLGYNATHYPIASQIHLVPTLSYLLGVPIPFGNLGALLPDVLIPNGPIQSKDQILLHMIQQFRMNALQVYHYLETYWHHTKHLGFSPHSLNLIYEHLWNAERLFSNDYNYQQQQQHDDDTTIQLLEQILFEYNTFLINTIKYCDAIWAQFDVGSMVMGITIMVTTACATLFTALRSNPSVSLRQIIIVWGTSLIVSFAWITLFDNVQKHDWFEKMGLMDGVVAINCIALAILFLIMPSSPTSSLATTSNMDNTIPLDWLLLVVGTLTTAFTLASNSFVIWEDRGTRFIAATLCVIWLFRSMATMQHPLDTDKVLEMMSAPLLVLIWIRVTGLTGQCREEQFPYCSYIHNIFFKLGEGSVLLICYILFNAYLSFYFLPRYFYRSIPKGLVTIGFTSAYSISLSIAFLRQLATIYQNSPQGPEIQLIPNIYLALNVQSSPTSIIVQLSPDLYETLVKILDVYAPRTVYTFTILTTFFCTLMMKTKYKPTLASSCPGLLLFMWSVTLAILQQPLGSTILLSTPLIIDLLVADQKTSTQSIRVALVSIIGQHLFFVTAHQATFTSLPWKAAFVGFDYMNYYGGATLVGLSTLSGYIVTWLGWLAILYHSDKFSRIASVIQRLSVYLMILLQAIPTCLSAIFVLILRRHLMTWKIFAPRFIVQGLIGMGTSMAVTACEWLLQG